MIAGWEERKREVVLRSKPNAEGNELFANHARMNPANAPP